MFDAGDSMLATYASRFDCVEINSSFYRPHLCKSYERWAASVPADFRFSVKLPKLVTHEMRLEGVGKPLDAFASQVAGLGAKLGGILVQLPPSLVLDLRVATRFFTMLRRRFPEASLACEARHASWFGPAGDALWQRHVVSRVGADPPPVEGADRPGGSGSWRYWRMHGSPRMYYSAYGEAALAALAAAVRDAATLGAVKPMNAGRVTPAGRECWVVFDNTAHGHATSDALQLRSLLD
jgi:uncharacterized protein YecE (DUF72 family)